MLDVWLQVASSCWIPYAKVVRLWPSKQMYILDLPCVSDLGQSRSLRMTAVYRFLYCRQYPPHYMNLHARTHGIFINEMKMMTLYTSSLMVRTQKRRSLPSVKLLIHSQAFLLILIWSWNSHQLFPRVTPNYQDLTLSAGFLRWK